MVPGAKVKAEILMTANEFCAKSGKTMQMLAQNVGTH